MDYDKKQILKRKIIIIAIISVFVGLLFVIGQVSKEKVDPAIVQGSPEKDTENIVLITKIKDGPFTVKYMGTLDDGTYVVSISNSSPSGRIKALQWLREQKFDLEKMQIFFEDYANPLETEGAFNE